MIGGAAAPAPEPEAAAVRAAANSRRAEAPPPKVAMADKPAEGFIASDRDHDGIEDIPDEKPHARKRKVVVQSANLTVLPNNMQNLSSYDASVVVQSGPGVPTWTWSTVTLGWNGPVERTQRLVLWLIPPRASMLLSFLRVALVAALVLLLLGGWRRVGGALARLGTPAAGVLLLLAGVLVPRAAHADVAETALPSEEVLDNLRERLLAKPDCHPLCASIGRLSLDAVPDRLRLRFEVGAAAATAVALPGNAQHWLPSSELLDGKPARALTRDEDGGLWLRLAPGGHQVVLEGPLPAREVVQIPFPSPPHAVTTSAHGWHIEGLTEEGQIEENLQLVREAKPKPGDHARSGLEAASLPPFVTVERSLELGLKWMVRTRVARQTPAGAAVVLDVPLLAGESVVSEGVHVVKDRARVNLGPNETEASWTSTVPQRERIVLTAPAAGSAAAAAWAETWVVAAGPLWHVAFAGIPPAEPPAAGDTRTPTYRPWPGETLTVAVSRPGGTGGQTLTVDASDLQLHPGIRTTEALLTVSFRGSHGGPHVITLPDGAGLEEVSVNGAAQPLRQEGRRVTVPLAPGAQRVIVRWRDARPLGVLYRGPEIDVGAPGVNASVDVHVPPDRWTLSVGGPPLGPAVLFWSLAVVVALAGLALGRSRLTPLRAPQWVLLTLGIAQTSIPAAIFVTAFLLVLGWRRTLPSSPRAWAYDLGQLAFAAAAVGAAAALFAGVEAGLVDQPDMRVAGNGSFAELLRWFADRTAGALPRPWVVSVPLLTYRLVMLAWSLWLALSVIRWARWVWACFAEGGLWRPLRRRPPVSPTPPPAPPEP
jgi:hypothetical protein